MLQPRQRRQKLYALALVPQIRAGSEFTNDQPIRNTIYLEYRRDKPLKCHCKTSLYNMQLPTENPETLKLCVKYLISSITSFIGIHVEPVFLHDICLESGYV
jgi:hypothetical protein